MKHKQESSAGGIVYKKTDDNDVLWLITQHSKHKGWGFPKGLIGDEFENEKMEDAAIREVEEEGGVRAQIIHPDPISVSYKYRYEEYLVDKSVHYFLMKYISGDTNNHDWEVSEAKFVNEKEVMSTLSFKTDKDAFEKILKIYNEENTSV